MSVVLNGTALREIRARSGMSVTKLAQLAGIKQSHLSNIEAGRRNASEPVARALARALKIDLMALIAEDGRRPARPMIQPVVVVVVARKDENEEAVAARVRAAVAAKLANLAAG